MTAVLVNIYRSLLLFLLFVIFLSATLSIPVFTGPLWLPEEEATQEDRIQTVQENALNLQLDTVAGDPSKPRTPAQLVSNLSVERGSASEQRGVGDGQYVAPAAERGAVLGIGQSQLPVEEPAKDRETQAAAPKVDKRPRRQQPKKLVRYPVIGRNNVAVPTHLYKVLSCYRSENNRFYRIPYPTLRLLKQ
jgi:hypothetical protein